MSILGALCLRGTLEPMCVNGATDGRVFLTFLKDVLLPQLWPGAVVVMDNLGAHQGGWNAVGLTASLLACAKARRMASLS